MTDSFIDTSTGSVTLNLARRWLIAFRPGRCRSMHPHPT